MMKYQESHVQPPALEPARITVIHCDLTLRAVGQLLSWIDVWTQAFCFKLEYLIVAGDLFFWCPSTPAQYCLDILNMLSENIQLVSVHCCVLIKFVVDEKRSCIWSDYINLIKQAILTLHLIGMCLHFCWCKRRQDTKEQGIDLY